MSRTRDPICNHINELAVSVQTHQDLVGANERGEPHAAVTTCGRNECVADAQRWLQELADLCSGVVIPLNRKRGK